MRQFLQSIPTRLAAACWLLIILAGMSTAQAAEPEFVGRLALLVEPEIVRQLDLTDETLAELRELIADREDAVLDMALEIKDLPEDERKAKLAPFVAESERLGLALLSDAQREQFEQLRLQRAASDAEVDDAEVADDDPAPSEPGADDDAGDEPPRPAVDDRSPIATGPSPDGKIRFNFRFAPWKDVLDWFAQQADLSLVLDAPPPGTFNYTDRRAYTPAEAIDLLNGVLLTKGYTLVRRERMLMLVNLEDGVPPNLVPQIPLAELDKRGEFELVSVLFQLDKLDPAVAEVEVRKLLGPQGDVIVLPSAKQILVTETAGRLRTIRSVINAVEDPDAAQQAGQLTEFQLEHAAPEEVLIMVRQLLGMPEDQNALPDGSLRIAVDPLGSRLIVTGKYDKIAQVAEILKLVDVPSGLEEGPRSVEQPQLEVYAITTADPASVLAVMQTLMAGLPDVRLAIDPKTGSLVAYARPSQHATIRATLDQMQQDGKQIEVIQLYTVDPQLAVLAINRLFGGTAEAPNPNAPIVDAEPITRQLLVRGTQSQIDQINSLLEKMGETPDAALAAESGGGNVRLLPFTGSQARATLDQMQELWPNLHRNRIRVVTPSAVIRTLRPNEPQEVPQGVPQGRLPLDDFDRLFPREKAVPPQQVPEPEEAAPQAQQHDVDPASSAPNDTQDEPSDRQARRSASHGMFVTQVGSEPEDSEPRQASEPPAQEPSVSGAEIFVSVGPSGVVIASEDTEALDEFEAMFRALSESSVAGPEYTVFYLKYAQAEVAADLLTSILGGEAADAGGGGGGSLLGDLAGAALGGGGGGGGDLLGGLLGLGGDAGLSGLAASGTVNVVAEPRLNALVVQAGPTDLDLIEQMLKIIDQESSPEDVQTIAPPRLIPVFNTSAEEVAKVVGQVYAQQMASAPGAQQQPSPQDFIRALRGGRGGRGGGGNDSRQAQQAQLKMTMSVDARSNSLVVSAPDPLFQDVRSLVQLLDQVGEESAETMQVVALKGVNPEVVQRALSSLAGDNVTVSTSSAGGSNGPRARSSDDDDDQRRAGENAQQQIQQRIELFNQLQRLGSEGRGQRGQRGDSRRRRGDDGGREGRGGR